MIKGKVMIRKAEKKDIPAVLGLLSQVLEIHAAIRPDLFVSGTTKYSFDELEEIFRDDDTPVFVAETEDGVVGYVFCVIKEIAGKANLVPHKTLYIDDLCVDASRRGKHIGRALFEYACAEAKKLGCYDVTLNVWAGNHSAERFYENLGMKPRSTYMELKL